MIVSALVCMLIAAVIQIAAGAYATSWRETLGALGDRDLWSHPATLLRIVLGDPVGDTLGLARSVEIDTSTLIVWSVRLPRILLAVLVGINLGISGTIFQGITRNELAGPYLLGVSSGAGLAILLVLVAFPGFGPHLPLIASAGGLGAFLLVYAIAWRHGTSSIRLVLAGVIVAAIGGALQTALFLLMRDLATVQDAVSWTTGSLTGADWERVRIALPWTVVTTVLALGTSRYLDVMLLGDAAARSLGVSTERVRFGLAVIAVLAASTTIAVAGMIGFVGLIVPHIVRTATGPTSRPLLIGCFFVGPAIMLVADTAARLAFSPLQVPVGIVTGVLGGGYFLYLMRREQQLIRP
ncbi:Iron-uptake system permease protein FeuC [Planctomycetes bacterium Poly30]|uniref:Iron-uptake system permease protein FeuC n=2 Tax=Saltatorellus ferox TaxID=2528018 RepID=A0A518EVN6_9BACT|nr:Iron-uptake system permease protein FeuC [Planctomycetes bacterium Poly30]